VLAPGCTARHLPAETARWSTITQIYEGTNHARQWVIHGERLVDDTPHVRVSLADVELPNHVRFTQYVFRMRRVVVTLVLAAPALSVGPQVIMPDDRWPVAFPGIEGVAGHQVCTLIKKCDPVSDR